MEATTPELGPVRFWSPKSSSFSGSDSIVVEEAAKNLLSPRPSVLDLKQLLCNYVVCPDMQVVK